jgi:hypothetical protein
VSSETDPKGGDKNTQVLPGKRRRVPRAVRVAARVAKFHARDCAPVAEGVMACNAGFFQLERMRYGSPAKARATKKTKARSK